MAAGRRTAVSPSRRSLIEQPLTKLFVIALLALAYCVSSPVASARERFFWGDHYSYARRAAKPATWSCPGGYAADAGRCYGRCPEGYHPSAAMCLSNKPNRANRRRPTSGDAMASCSGGAKVDAGGVCRTRCRPGYHGIGATCIENAPPGYVTCGTGFAATDSICGYVKAAWAAALSQPTAAEEAANAKKREELGSQGVQYIGKLSHSVEPLEEQLLPIVTSMAKGTETAAKGIAKAENLVKQFLSGPDGTHVLKMAKQLAKPVGGGALQPLNGLSPTAVMDDTRLIFTITSIVDPQSREIVAYAFPLYQPNAHPNNSTFSTASVNGSGAPTPVTAY